MKLNMFVGQMYSSLLSLGTKRVKNLNKSVYPPHQHIRISVGGPLSTLSIIIIGKLILLLLIIIIILKKIVKVLQKAVM